MTKSIGEFKPIPSITIDVIRNDAEYDSTNLPSGRLEILNPFTAKHENYYLFIDTQHTEEDRINYSLLTELIKRGTLRLLTEHWNVQHADAVDEGLCADQLIASLGHGMIIQDFRIMPQELRGYPYHGYFKVSPGLWFKRSRLSSADDLERKQSNGIIETLPEDQCIKAMSLENRTHEQLFDSDDDFIERVSIAWGAVTTSDTPFAIGVLNGNRL
jgi:hypothetical protein